MKSPVDVSKLVLIFTVMDGLQYNSVTPCALNNIDRPILRNIRRQNKVAGNTKPSSTRGTRSTTTRTTTVRVSVSDDCDHYYLQCMRAYKTGVICTRTAINHYVTFDNYCKMDYVNCREKHEVFQIIHMGQCELEKLQEPEAFTHHYPHFYEHDYFLDNFYFSDNLMEMYKDVKELKHYDVKS